MDDDGVVVLTLLDLRIDLLLRMLRFFCCTLESGGRFDAVVLLLLLIKMGLLAFIVLPVWLLLLLL